MQIGCNAGETLPSGGRQGGHYGNNERCGQHYLLTSNQEVVGLNPAGGANQFDNIISALASYQETKAQPPHE